LVIPEKIHTCPTDGFLEILSGGEGEGWGFKKTLFSILAVTGSQLFYVDNAMSFTKK